MEKRLFRPQHPTHNARESRSLKTAKAAGRPEKHRAPIRPSFRMFKQRKDVQGIALGKRKPLSFRDIGLGLGAGPFRICAGSDRAI
jgi:hypothetical protein